MAGDPRFLEGLDDLRALHLSKGHDYADAGDPLRNYQVSADDNGVPAWRAAQLRLSEKYHRLCNLTRGTERAPNHESLDDTLLDLAAMALIVRSLRARGPHAYGQPVRHINGQTGTVESVITVDRRRVNMFTPDPVQPAAADSTTDAHEPAQRWQHADPGDEAGA
jgi:hypothetical protein